mmetsp:Transcript_56696/g.169372  ORF Transcript_56696/g.169372 Transcript_56696/m.169372 type:complete len:253 (+) Transcript_56696:324-1082(+)
MLIESTNLNSYIHPITWKRGRECLRKSRKVCCPVDSLSIGISTSQKIQNHLISSQKLLNIILAETTFLVPSFCLLQLGEYIIKARDITALRINIDQRPRDVKKSDHLVAVVVDHQSVRLSRRLEDVRPGLGVPVVFFVSPPALHSVRVHRRGVAVTAERAATDEFEQVHIISLGGAEAQRPEGEALRLGDPDARVFVLSAHRGNDDVAQRFDGRRGQRRRRPSRESRSRRRGRGYARKAQRTRQQQRKTKGQ